MGMKRVILVEYAWEWAEPKIMGKDYGKGETMANLEQQVEIYKKKVVSAREIGDQDGEANALFDLGFTYWSLNRNENAIRCYDQIFILDPDYPYLWYYKGESLNELGRHEEAIYCFDKQLVLDPWRNGLLVLQRRKPRQFEPPGRGRTLF